MSQREASGELAYPALVGILGGGQLARMMAEAASSLGIEVAILEHEAGSPAARLAAREVVGTWTDTTALAMLAEGALAATLENEFVEVDALEYLARLGVPVYPTARTLATVQDKVAQKRFMQEADVPVPAFSEVASHDDVLRAGEAWGWPLVLKARRNGYDGYGNATLRAPEEIEAAFARLGWPERQLLVEAWVPFERELAVMVARGQDGASVVYPVVETVQQNHICHLVRAPASGDPMVLARAAEIARRAVEATGGVGVFGVELFEIADGTVLYNEIAPRPHNSGHYTIEGCVTSQFENAVCAVLGLPLGSTKMVAPAAVMVNLLGTHVGPAHTEGLSAALAVPGAHVHIYGKLTSRPGRKMGHVTALGATLAEAEARARQAAEALRL
ncbi:MAG TPA: 5-(carboxyamino)imidazole ribonucleotide synthase [Ktedonobacterales bacterium]|jgi:5-(carboxyamino)imidazole ribonucleotide synthase|nr:5-(carboxyamino)imidazole ribonucleotide synthase [Ktedonobacterales bacterium]